MIDHKHHVGQLKKNWGVVTSIFMVVFGAGMVWAYTQRDFVEVQTFEVHVEAEERYIEEKFDALASPILSDGARRRVKDAVWALEDVESISDLMDLCVADLD